MPRRPLCQLVSKPHRRAETSAAPAKMAAKDEEKGRDDKKPEAKAEGKAIAVGRRQTWIQSATR